MCKYMRNFDFIFMMILVGLEIALITINLLDLFEIFDPESEKYFKKQNSIISLIESIVSISIEIASVWIVIVYGIHSLYFKIIDKLYCYIYA